MVKDKTSFVYVVCVAIATLAIFLFQVRWTSEDFVANAFFLFFFVVFVVIFLGMTMVTPATPVKDKECEKKIPVAELMTLFIDPPKC